MPTTTPSLKSTTPEASIVPTPPPKPKNWEQRLQQKFEQFMESLGEGLTDITALEVNTMVVCQITGNKFVPEEAYRDIYFLTESCWERRQIPESLRDRYTALRKRLRSEYRQIVGNPEVELPDPDREGALLDYILASGEFLRTLRKIKEVKAALDSSDPTNSNIDIICAQTVMQLDGDIINRYDRRLFEEGSHSRLPINLSKHRDLLMDVHRQGVQSGEEQWHGLLHFIVKLVSQFVQNPSNPFSFLDQNGSK